MMKMKQTKPVNALAIGMYRPVTVLADRGSVLPESVEYWFPFNTEEEFSGGMGEVVPIFHNASKASIVIVHNGIGGDTIIAKAR